METKVYFGRTGRSTRPCENERLRRRPRSPDAITTPNETDETGNEAVKNRVSVNDLHATILHLQGMDHERLTYRYSGRDFRLTDVAGNVVPEIVA